MRNYLWLLYRVLSVLTDPSSWRQYIRYQKISFSSFLINKTLYSIDPSLNVIIDVGANMGQFCIAAKYRFPDATIHSYEPVPDTFDILVKNARGKAKDLHFHKKALGAEVGEISFYQNKYSHVSSALEVSKSNNQEKYHLGLEKVIKVPVSTLDEEFKDADFHGPILLKLDVQGYEKVVLQGGSNFLEKVDYILLEMPFVKLYENQFSYTEINDYLVSIGFEMFQPLDFNYGVNFHIIEMDALYKRAKRSN